MVVPKYDITSVLPPRELSDLGKLLSTIKPVLAMVSTEPTIKLS
jgi:hypothetical protein